MAKNEKTELPYRLNQKTAERVHTARAALADLTYQTPNDLNIAHLPLHDAADLYRVMVAAINAVVRLDQRLNVLNNRDANGNDRT